MKRHADLQPITMQHSNITRHPVAKKPSFGWSIEHRTDGTLIKRFSIFSFSLLRISKNIKTLIIRILGIPFISSKMECLDSSETLKLFGFPLKRTTYSRRQAKKTTYLFGIKIKSEPFLSQYSMLERIMNDRRFRLDFEFFFNVLQYADIESYDVVKIKLKDIRVLFNNNIYSIEDSHVLPMQYLKEKRDDIYITYLNQLSKKGLLTFSKEKFDNLINSLEKDYDEKFMPVLDKNNILKDGQHRCCFLYQKYGRDKEISVVKIILKEGTELNYIR